MAAPEPDDLRDTVTHRPRGSQADITAGVCAFPLTSAVTERDADLLNLRSSLSKSDLADGCHQRSTIKLPVERHPERETAS